MTKVTYQFAAVVDTCPNVIAEYNGESKLIRIDYGVIPRLPMSDAASFLNTLEREVCKAFNIEGPLDLVDVSPELKAPTGPHESIGFGSFREDS